MPYVTNLETGLYPFYTSVNAAVRNITNCVERILSSVRENATSIIAMETKEYQIQIHRFKTAQKIALSLYEEGVLSKEELEKITTRLKKKYGIKNKSVFID